jgi:spore coat polysaccharide biosynthesis protein SpsF (cytidylyltransferase family)
MYQKLWEYGTCSVESVASQVDFALVIIAVTGLNPFVFLITAHANVTTRLDSDAECRSQVPLGMGVAHR